MPELLFCERCDKPLKPHNLHRIYEQVGQRGLLGTYGVLCSQLVAKTRWKQGLRTYRHSGRPYLFRGVQWGGQGDPPIM